MRAAVLCCLLCLGPICCLAAQEVCDGMLQEVSRNSFLAYTYSLDAGGTICQGVQRRCNSTIEQSLSGRTWFIQDVKNASGFGYRNNWLQVHNVQCPRGHLLHLFMLSLDTQGTIGACTVGDYVNVSADGLDSDILICGDDLQQSGLYNGGLGRIVGSSATIGFCSNEMMGGAGFVLVATCLNPAEYNWPGCTDFQFFQAWDPDFVNIINNEFPTPERFIPFRKRSVEKRALRIDQQLKSGRRLKRNLRLIRYQFGVNDTVTYRNMRVTLMFGNGSLPITVDDVRCLTTFNRLIGTRAFYNNSAQTFTGPGDLEVYGTNGNLNWTIGNPNEFFLPSFQIMNAVRRIYDYTYSNWLQAYPILTDMNPNPDEFPLANASTIGYPYRRLSDLGSLFPAIQGSSECRQAINILFAPIQSSAVARDLKRFCTFFRSACHPILRAACRELNLLDPYRVWLPPQA